MASLRCKLAFRRLSPNRTVERAILLDVSDETEPDKHEIALRRVRRFVATYVAKGKYELYPETEVVENVVQGLADNLVAHGRMYCPCAPIEDSKAKGSDMVCPCTPHHADIERQGYCDCALFASADFVAAERLTKK